MYTISICKSYFVCVTRMWLSHIKNSYLMCIFVKSLEERNPEQLQNSLWCCSLNELKVLMPIRICGTSLKNIWRVSKSRKLQIKALYILDFM